MYPSLTEAQQKLVEAHMKLANYLAAGFGSTHFGLLSRRDRQQEAYLGLCQAASRFDPSRGVKFGTFAYYLIRQQLIRALHEAPFCRLPYHRSLAKKRRKLLRTTPLEEVPLSKLPIYEIEEKEDPSFIKLKLEIGFLALNAKEKRAVKLRFGLDKVDSPHTLYEIGRQLLMTKQGVGYLLDSALSKMGRTFH